MYFKKLWMTKRPYLDIFIRKMSKKFNLILFTASDQSYADCILKIIDPFNDIFLLKFYRHNCLVKNNVILKNLEFIYNLNLNKTVFIDNSPIHFYKNSENIVPIIPFFGDAKDQELIKLEKFLKFLFNKKDFRDTIKDTFFINEFFKKQSFGNILKKIVKINE